MSALASIAKSIQETNAQLATLQRELASHPHERSLLVNIRALEKRVRMLEARFEELAKNQYLDICDYRLIAAIPDRYPIAAVGTALSTFQNMVTVFFDAIKTGPKTRARVAADVAELASMNLGYTYAGSLGFTLTVPNERLLLVGSDLDLAIERAFQVINATEIDDIAALAREVGVASIRSAYGWAKHHARFQMSADIEWKRGSEVRNRTTAHSEQLARLADLIEKTSEVTQEQVTLVGTLVGVDTHLGTFHFEPETGESIRGRLAETFGVENPVRIPSVVTVELSKRTKVHYSIEKEEITWELRRHYSSPNTSDTRDSLM